MGDVAPEVVSALALSLRAEHPDIAGFLEHPLTLVEPMDAPFLRRYGIYRVMPRHLSRPVLLYVAGGPGLTAHLLGPKPETLTEVVRLDGSTLDDAAAAVAFVETLIEVVGPRPGLVRVLSSAADIPYRDDLTDEDGRAKAVGEAELAGRLEPPQPTRDGDHWRVTAWIARGQAVQREAIVVTTAAEVQGQTVEVSVDLPLILVN